MPLRGAVIAALAGAYLCMGTPVAASASPFVPRNHCAETPAGKAVNVPESDRRSEPEPVVRRLAKNASKGGIIVALWGNDARLKAEVKRAVYDAHRCGLAVRGLVRGSESSPPALAVFVDGIDSGAETSRTTTASASTIPLEAGDTYGQTMLWLIFSDHVLKNEFQKYHRQPAN